MTLLLSALFTISAALDPEVNLNAPGIIKHWGYPAETHYATTEDGYILALHRIPYGRNESSGGCRPVIFLQHGIMCDSTAWIVNIPEKSAGFVFADAGFDVWIGNMRGNTYSTNHTTLSPLSEAFWNFSWDEMARYDLDAMIGKALNVSGQDQLYYAAHSQGTITMFAKLSYDPTFASKINKFFGLAPIAAFINIQGLLKFIGDYFNGVFYALYDIIGPIDFLPDSFFTHLYASIVCPGPFGDEVCSELYFLIGGPQTAQYNMSRTPVYTAHYPAGTSSKNIKHFMQLMHVNGTVYRYNYDTPEANVQHYGTPVPPSYDLSTIATDMYLFTGVEDYLADAYDVTDYLLAWLNPAYVKQLTNLTGFNHFDFIWGTQAAEDIYTPIAEIIKKDQLQC